MQCRYAAWALIACSRREGARSHSVVSALEYGLCGLTDRGDRREERLRQWRQASSSGSMFGRMHSSSSATDLAETASQPLLAALGGGQSAAAAIPAAAAAATTRAARLEDLPVPSAAALGSVGSGRRSAATTAVPAVAHQYGHASAHSQPQSEVADGSEPPRTRALRPIFGRHAGLRGPARSLHGGSNA